MLGASSQVRALLHGIETILTVIIVIVLWTPNSAPTW
jgi:hypothetical protein